MSKAVLISIRPKWVEKIARREKTIEVRKTRPKLETPFKCYIYCTLPKYPHEDFISTDYPRPQFYGGGKVVGEFTCDAITRVNICGFWDDSGKQLDNRLKETCLTTKEFCKYLGENVGYGWHISDLRIYDTPKELSEFKTLCRVDADCCACPYYNYTKMGCDGRVIGRPPQSWCYVDDVQAK
jgi:predicted transcriptional regulator